MFTTQSYANHFIITLSYITDGNRCDLAPPLPQCPGYAVTDWRRHDVVSVPVSGGNVSSCAAGRRDIVSLFLDGELCVLIPDGSSSGLLLLLHRHRRHPGDSLLSRWSVPHTLHCYYRLLIAASSGQSTMHAGLYYRYSACWGYCYYQDPAWSIIIISAGLLIVSVQSNACWVIIITIITLHLIISSSLCIVSSIYYYYYYY